MPTPPRRCSTCRHFQPAPLWRKGWCRHPLLYAPHQNHLVDERELDCHRQFGDYWEPIQEVDAAAELPPPSSTVADDAPTTSPLSDQGSTDVGRVAPPIEPTNPASTPDRDSAPVPDTAATQPSRADRMRLAVPAAIIGILLIAYLVWTGLLLRTAGDSPSATTEPATAAPGLVVTQAPTSVATTAPTVAPTIAPTAQPTPVSTTGPAGAATPTRQATPTGVRAGAPALVDTGGPDGLRLRRDPGSAGVVLRSIRNGERVSVTDGPREVEGVTWWRVTYGSDEGWVAGQYLKPAS